MAKKYYKVIFEPQEEGGYTVTVPSLPGCISEGDTYDEALANIKEAIALYLESLQADGLPVPEENHLIVEVKATYEQAAGAQKS
jgi:predicted RNase H-like HicB family nuclease